MRKNSIRIALLTALAGLSVPALAQTPLGTAFTYQGELNQSGTPVSGTFDLRFSLFDSAAGGIQVGPTLCMNDQTVTNGRFAVPLDFGSVFTGQARFVEIEVRQDSGLSCGDATGFELLAPRTELTAAPNALFATTATTATSAATATSATTAMTASNALSLGGQPAASFPLLAGNNTFSGVVTLNNASNVFTGSGAAITNLNANNLASGTVPSARLNGTYANALTLSNTGNVFTGNGAALTNLNANSISSGTIGTGRLPNSVVRTNISNEFGNFTNTFAGNVGIGTTTPTAPLDIAGKLSILSNGSIRATGLVPTGGSYNGMIEAYYGDADRYGVAQVQGVGLALYSSSTFPTSSVQIGTMTGANSFASSLTVMNTGNVGIGTTTPGARLDVAGKLSILDNGTIRTTGVASTFGSYNGMIESFYGNADRFGIAQVPNVGLAVYTSAIPGAAIQLGSMTGATAFVPVLTVRNTGGVGIGTTSPASKLSFGTFSDVNRPTIAVFESGANFAGFGREAAAMTFWSNGQVQAKLRDDGMFEVKAIQINGGADLVERFNSTQEGIAPGTLMVIDPANPGQLMVSTSAYDTKVAGIISGANGVSAGIHLAQAGVLDGDLPVAMTGRVYVKSTAAGGAIKPGDLLTTSDVPGHAMKAADADRRPGAVIGKAMTGLDSGTGLVLVLVNLQ